MTTKIKRYPEHDARLTAQYAGKRLRVKLQQPTNSIIDWNKICTIKEIRACDEQARHIDILTTYNDNGKRKEYKIQMADFELYGANMWEVYAYSNVICRKNCYALYTAIYKLLD